MCVTKVQNNNGNKFRGKIAKLPITLDAIAIEIDIWLALTKSKHKVGQKWENVATTGKNLFSIP